jgi:hypothetical protein
LTQAHGLPFSQIKIVLPQLPLGPCRLRDIISAAIDIAGGVFAAAAGNNLADQLAGTSKNSGLAEFVRV